MTEPPARRGDRLRSCLRREAPALLALVAFAAAEVVILLAGHYTFFAEPDNTMQFWAWYQKAAAVLHSGAVPLWDANTLAGHSFVGETQTGVFYPLNILWLLLVGSARGIDPRRLDILVVLHLLLASVGFYALARSFRVARLPAVIGGVVFAYTGVMFSRTIAQTAIFFGLVYIPWAVYFAHRQLETLRLRYAIGTGVSIGLALLAGHFQPPFHAALLALLVYVLTSPRMPGEWRAELAPRLKGLALTFAVGALVALPQLAYSLPYLSRAYRFVGPGPPIPPGGEVSYYTFSHLYSGGPDSALSLLDPQRYTVADGNELFLGIAALIVLVIGLVMVRGAIRIQLGRYRGPLFAAAAIGALALLGPWTPFPRILYALPLVSQVRELGRYSILLHLALCLMVTFTLQAIGQERLPGGGHMRRRELLSWIVGVGLAGDGAYLVLKHAPASNGWFGVQLLLGGAALLAFAAVRRPSQLLAALGFLVVVAALHNGGRLLGVTSSSLYPTRYFARTGAIAYVQKACVRHRTLGLGDALPNNVGDVYRTIHTQSGYGATEHTPYYDFVTSTNWKGPEQTRLLDERCIVNNGPLTIPGYHLGFWDRATGARVYVNENTSPLNTPSLRPIRAEALSDSDRRLTYSVTLRQMTTVIVSAIVYPGWQLRVDGRRVRAGSFRMGGVSIFPEVTVAPGHHIIAYSWSGWPA